MTQSSSHSGDGQETKGREGFWARLCRHGLLSNFARSKRANVAMSFALAAVPLIVATGTAVDLSRALIVRQRLIHALDAAGLAVGHTTGLTQNQIQQLATDFFNANYPHTELGSPGAVNVSVSGNDVHLTVSADLNTAIMKIVGINHLVVNVENTITKATRGLELSLVLDTTGSMAGSKLSGLQTAANQLLDILFGNSQYPDLLKVGIIPFSTAVRVDPVIADANGWLDSQGLSSTAKLNFSGGKYAYWLYTNAAGLGQSSMATTQWTGCVEARPNRLDETDTPPTTANPNSLWVPMFYPDEPHVNEPENSSLNPAAPNQGGLSSTFVNDYIANYATFTANNNTATGKISTATQKWNYNSHGLVSGDGPVRVTSMNVLPTITGIANVGTTDFWVIKVDTNNIKLATSRANALAGTAVNVTNVGKGTITIVESWGSGTGSGTANGGTSLVDQAARQKEWQKYIGKTATAGSGFLTSCDMQAMILPTNDKSALQAKIASLNAAGNTHIPLGLEWGWQLVSGRLHMPAANQTVDYSNTQYVKAIVLMTDGDNTMNNASNTLNGSDYTAYGYASQGAQRLGIAGTTGTAVQSEIDASMQRICTNIKAITDQDGNERIRLYTIAFGQSISSTAQNLLCNCAMTVPNSTATSCTGHAYFYAPTNADLANIFAQIATDLSNLRISQ